jgi:hypothetical protein
MKEELKRKEKKKKKAAGFFFDLKKLKFVDRCSEVKLQRNAT